MSDQVYSPESIQKLKEIIDEGVQLNHEIDTLNAGLKDTVKNVAEELGLKPAQLNKAIKICYKNSLNEERSKLDEVIDIIQAAGRD
jgi:tRNA U34 2-thiouridine synthase MnmA/TrmU